MVASGVAFRLGTPPEIASRQGASVSNVAGSAVGPSAMGPILQPAAVHQCAACLFRCEPVQFCSARIMN